MQRHKSHGKCSNDDTYCMETVPFQVFSGRFLKESGINKNGR